MSFGYNTRQAKYTHLPQTLDGLECSGTPANNDDTSTDRVASTAKQFWLPFLFVLEGIGWVRRDMYFPISDMSFERMESTWSRGILWNKYQRNILNIKQKEYEPMSPVQTLKHAKK